MGEIGPDKRWLAQYNVVRIAENAKTAMTNKNARMPHKYETVQVLVEFTQYSWVKEKILLLLQMVMLLSVTVMVVVSC